MNGIPNGGHAYRCCGNDAPANGSPIVVDKVGVSYRAVQQWAAWYRAGGLAKVLHHVTGHASRGATPYLNAKQQRALVARVALGDFKTVGEVAQWAEDRWGIR